MGIPRRVVLLLIAGLIAAFAAISVRNRLSQAPAEPTQVTSSRVIIAKHDLPLGSFIQGPQDLDFGNLPSGTPESGDYLYESAVKITDFNGAVVRRQMHGGDIVSSDALMKSGEGGFMSAVLEPGMRAVSIAVNATTGNAGFISPGDHVDLIVTHHVKLRGNGSDDSVVSETFVHDVRVVAVDQQLDNPENKAILAKTVTVEVSPRQAEQIAVAGEMGKIGLALRSLIPTQKKPEDAAQAAQKKPEDGQGGVVDLYGNATTDGSSVGNAADVAQMRDSVSPRVHVIRGDQSENLEFYQGAQ